MNRRDLIITLGTAAFPRIPASAATPPAQPPAPTPSSAHGEQIKEALAFYHGDQWPADIVRQRAGRPTLTFNRIPAIVEEILHDRGGSYSKEGFEALVVEVVNKARDPQQVYNWASSGLIEMTRTRPPYSIPELEQVRQSLREFRDSADLSLRSVAASFRNS